MDHHSSENNGLSSGINSSVDAAVGSAENIEATRLEEPPTSTSSSSLPWYNNPHQITAMLSNFSTSYNVVNISLVLPILQQLYPTNNSEDSAACASSLLAGMVVGQLVGGALGDSPWLGRLGALLLVMALQIAASIGSSLLFLLGGHNGDVYLWLAGWRFLLGIGAGGVYPLAAVLSAEQGGGGDRGQEDQSKNVDRVVLTFSTQGLGFVMVPIVSVVLLHTTNNLDLVWRLILGLGSLPGFTLMVLQYRMYNNNMAGQSLYPALDGRQLVPSEDSDEVGDTTNNDTLTAEQPQPPVAAKDSGRNQPLDPISNLLESNNPPNDQALITQDDQNIERVVSVNTEENNWLGSIVKEPGLVRKLFGTAGTWFLFDVLFYGNTIFQPIVVEAAFGGSDTDNPLELLRKTSLDSLILTSIALPGYAVAGLAMGEKKEFCCISQQMPRYVMLQGFAAMAVLYFTIGWNWSYLRHYPVVLVVLYGLTFFFANYGPNTTTFILPSITYSHECRSTLNGISAACGKLGALVGATLFEPAAEKWGDNYVMIICSAVSVVALILTHCCVPRHKLRPSSAPQPVPHTSGRNIV